MRSLVVILLLAGLHVWLCYGLFDATDAAKRFEPHPGDEQYAPMANMAAGGLALLVLILIEFIIGLVMGAVLYFIGALAVLRINGPLKRLKAGHWFLAFVLVGLATFVFTVVSALLVVV